MSTSPSIYFTKVDPDYSVKGSRDPLGFQVLWQRQARHLLPYLSTVCNTIRDFQIMCLAYHVYGRKPDKHFIRFFLRFEQLMGYTRLELENTGFNGIDRVRKNRHERGRISVSTQQKDEILSNQRAYGIWGKYNRPFTEIGLSEDERFEALYTQKIEQLPAKAEVKRVLQQVVDKEHAVFDRGVTDILQPLLERTPAEVDFFTDKILLIRRATPYQNQLYHYVRDSDIPNQLNLYAFLDDFANSRYGSTDGLIPLIQEIKATEKVLAPLNRIFRFLQGKPFWTKDEIESSQFIAQCRPLMRHVFETVSEENKDKNGLEVILQSDNWSLVRQLVVRNTDVSESRGGAAWMSIKNDLLEVYHQDGTFHDPDFDPEKDVDNYYFINTYLHLFEQLQ
jgi:hypothetical protein